MAWQKEALVLASTLVVYTLSSSDVVVTSSQGKLRGRSNAVFGNPVETFLGVPYALPPVGNRRFRKPVPLTTWDGVYDATVPKQSCMQPVQSGRFEAPVPFSEDCLYLNVWTPSTSDSLRRPVLVWFYGGLYMVGSAYVDIYNATVLAAFNDLVVVSCDFRSSMYGFFESGDAEEGPGNVGLWDQRLVLVWIRDNIAAFGGDPDQVTLFGVSSGSMLAHAHVLSPLSRGLFRRVYLMSGTLNINVHSDSATDSVYKGNQVAAIVGCATPFQDLTTHTRRVLDCLRNVTADRIDAATVIAMLPGLVFFMPTFRSEFIPMLPSAASEAGAFSPVDAVVSVTSNEGSFAFVNQFDQRLLDPCLSDIDMETLQAEVEQLLRMWVKEKVLPFAQGYVATAAPGNKIALRDKAVDFLGKHNAYCQSRFFAEDHSKFAINVYAQVFAHRSKKSTLPEWVAASHMDDVPYTFGIPFLEPDKYTDEDRNFSAVLMKSLAAFAENGVPKIPELQYWPPFSATSPNFAWLQPGNYSLLKDFLGTTCDLWRNFL
ncbi:acetylcholinesterase-like [Dermacentor silvarum]|uniref:acetylcholinesterase-like n=1 Tax=Dermacentor silvarum TaxID=543639 RepID=UPI002101841E|nr:acetylcholinesterase-like [Dermacentor silvarum]